MDHGTLNIYITGFGKFGNVQRNPTTDLVERMQYKRDAGELFMYENINFHSMEVLDVHIPACDDHLGNVFK